MIFRTNKFFLTICVQPLQLHSFFLSLSRRSKIFCSSEKQYEHSDGQTCVHLILLSLSLSVCFSLISAVTIRQKRRIYKKLQKNGITNLTITRFFDWKSHSTNRITLIFFLQLVFSLFDKVSMVSHANFLQWNGHII